MTITSRKQRIKEYKRKINDAKRQSPFIDVDRELDEWSELPHSQKPEMISFGRA